MMAIWTVQKIPSLPNMDSGSRKENENRLEQMK